MEKDRVVKEKNIRMKVQVKVSWIIYIYQSSMENILMGKEKEKEKDMTLNKEKNMKY